MSEHHTVHEDPYEVLSEHDGTERLDVIAEQNRQAKDHFAHVIQKETIKLVTEVVDSVEFQFAREALDKIVDRRDYDYRIVIDSSEANWRYDRIQERKNRLLDGLGSAEKVQLRAEFMAEMFGVVSNGDVHCYDRLLTLLISAADGEIRFGDQPGDEELANLLEAWKSRDARQIWKDLAARQPAGLATEAALAREMGILALVGKLAPPEFFVWEDRAEIVDRIERVLGKAEMAFPIDAKLVYETIVQLQEEFKLGFLASVELAKDIFAAAGIQNGVSFVPKLSVDKPIIKDSIAKLERIGDKLVFILTGTNGENLVLKFEIRLDTEHSSDFSRRYETTRDVAQICLERLPKIEFLKQTELEQLLGLGAKVEGGAELLKQLRAGLLDSSLGVKMEHVDVGDSLAKMRSMKNVPKTLLSRRTLRDLGKLAMFDLLTGNEDRFHEKSLTARDSFCNLENIDFRHIEGGRYEVIPLDNLSPKDVVSMGLEEFKGREFIAIGDGGKRLEYARELLLWLCDKLELPKPDGYGLAFIFQEGMEAALVAMRDYIALLNRPGRSRRSPFLEALILRIAEIK